jgi:hypothetical protein
MTYLVLVPSPLILAIGIGKKIFRIFRWRWGFVSHF